MPYCDLIPQVAKHSHTESNGLGISKCDYNDTDVESATSDYETETTNRFVILTCRRTRYSQQ